MQRMGQKGGGGVKDTKAGMQRVGGGGEAKHTKGWGAKGEKRAKGAQDGGQSMQRMGEKHAKAGVKRMGAKGAKCAKDGGEGGGAANESPRETFTTWYLSSPRIMNLFLIDSITFLWSQVHHTFSKSQINLDRKQINFVSLLGSYLC